MATVKDFEDLVALLLLSHDDGDLTDEELLLMMSALEDDRCSALYPIQEIGPRLCIDSLNEEQCKRRFRFSKNQLFELCAALQLPDELRSPCRKNWSGMEGLLVVLRRLVYPGRLRDLVEEFGRANTSLSLIFNITLLWLWDRWGFLLDGPFGRPYFTPARVQGYCEAITEKSGIDLRVWGFIDGTLRRICRPGRYQQIFYSGQKKMHGLKYQAITTPDGLIQNLYGPIEGRRHDAGMFGESGILGQLEQHMHIPGDANGGVYALFGDSAYPLSPYLQKKFQGNVTPLQQLFNSRMGGMRQAVEWAFDDIATYWAFIDMKRQQKILLQTVGTCYKVATILANCITIMAGRNKTSDYFGVEPPSLEEYLA